MYKNIHSRIDCNSKKLETTYIRSTEDFINKLSCICTVNITMKINRSTYFPWKNLTNMTLHFKKQMADAYVQYDAIYIQDKTCKYYGMGNYLAAVEAFEYNNWKAV